MSTVRLVAVSVVWFLALAFAGFAACVPAVDGCPVAVASSSCAVFELADLPGRCEAVLPGSAPLVIKRTTERAGFACEYPPPLGVFVLRSQCGEGSAVAELWCLL